MSQQSIRRISTGRIDTDAIILTVPGRTSSKRQGNNTRVTVISSNTSRPNARNVGDAAILSPSEPLPSREAGASRPNNTRMHKRAFVMSDSETPFYYLPTQSKISLGGIDLIPDTVEDLVRHAGQLIEQLEPIDEDVESQTSTIRPSSYIRVRPSALSNAEMLASVKNSADVDQAATLLQQTLNTTTAHDQKPIVRKGTEKSNDFDDELDSSEYESSNATTLCDPSKDRTLPEESSKPSTIRSNRQGEYHHQDRIYAHIVDDQTGRRAGVLKLVRRIQGFGNLRLAEETPVIQTSEQAEPLGVLLAPPPGSNHFEVQLTICGLLRSNAACRYELYHFFQQNGFFDHSSTSPTYESWAADYSNAIEGKNAFYHEGMRVGQGHDLDFLREVFQKWCDAWHDWRLARPVPN